MSSSSAGAWLEDSLLQLTSSGSSVQLEPDLIGSLVSYCEMAKPDDAAEYLMNIVTDEKCEGIVAEYLRRRGSASVSSPDKPNEQLVMHAYVKPRDDGSWSTASRKPQKGKSQENGRADAEKNATISNSSSAQKSSIQRGGQGAGKGKRGGKGVSLAEASQGQIVFKHRAPCSCQCTRHKLVNNCLSCGRIVCEQEGEGPCTFCGSLVLREGSDYAGLDGVALPTISEAEIQAEEFKNRLVEYDRTSASRTTVIDDQSDYFQIDGNAWLSEKERQLLKKRQEDEERMAEEKKKRVVVTIDLLGRKVVMADEQNAEEEGEGISILGGHLLVDKNTETLPHIKPNPFLKDAPVFVEDKPYKPINSNIWGQQWTGEARMRNGRIQHDDPIIEALVGHDLESLGLSSVDDLNFSWQNPTVKSYTSLQEDDSLTECRLDMKDMNISATPHSGNEKSPELFDICLPRSKMKQSPVALAPSLLNQKQAGRQKTVNESYNLVIQEGLVLLKGWLTLDQQVDIVRQCRHLGIGQGGFYQPQYNDNNKMHLRMMCLGMHWQPTTRAYSSLRTHYDNAPAPPIPESFSRMVDKALAVAQVVAAQDSMGSSKRVVVDQNSSLPHIVPNVCIVNFYEFSGSLGMHQDKDESPESLQKGFPVVSFSVGDSGEFLYGWNANPGSATKIILESGDVLIFGGPSRMIFHGVPHIMRGTAPETLLQKTNLRPGRLNLTFRRI